MIRKFTITVGMEQDLWTNNYWAYVAWHVNQQLLDLYNMICKQTITGRMLRDI